MSNPRRRASSPAKRRPRTPRDTRAPRVVAGFDPFADPGGAHYNHESAELVVGFFAECLRHQKGELAGKPFELEPWQADLLRTLWGWRRKDGTRRFREAWIEVPRKNGKSTLAAGIALALLFLDRELGAEIFSAAADREQARIVYEIASGMVSAEDELLRRTTVLRSAIVYEREGSSYKPISSDAFTKHGLNAHGAVCDEVHAWPTAELFEVLQTSMGARRQPLLVSITTAGHDRETLAWRKHLYAEKVRDRVISDPAFLPCIFAAGEKDDWTSEETWARANPGLGTSLSLEYLRRECARAKEEPTYENAFRRLHLNQWTEQAVRWIQMHKWDAAPRLAALEELRGRPCWVGLDLASTLDLTAACQVWAFPDGTYACRPHFWVPGENAEQRERRDKVPYLTWAKQGFVTLTEGNVCDYERLHDDLLQLHREWNVEGIAIDPWNSRQLSTQLGAQGVNVVEFRQGFASFADPCRHLERLVMAGMLAHGGNPVLRWCASNVAVEIDAAGNMKPSKRRSTERIDGMVALLMGLGMAAKSESGSVYDGRGFLTL
jgi:phage terminase large subunit-like protein